MGKSLQSVNAMAVRPPAASTSAAPSPGEPVTAESLGWQLRAALPPLRLHSVSLYDREANVLWLSEGALGPDEHSLVYEAIDALTAETSQNCYETGMEDGRVGIFLPVRAPRGDLVGVAMILADLKSVNDGVLEKMTSPQVRTVMQKVAVLLRANAPKSNGADAAVPVLDSDASASVSVSSTVTVKALSSAAEPPAAAPVAAAAPAAAKPSPAPALRPVAAAPAAKVAAKLAAHEAKPAAQETKRAPQEAKRTAPEKASARAEPVQAARPAAQPASQPVPAATPALLSPEAVDDILEFELTPDIQPIHTDSVPTLSVAELPGSGLAPPVTGSNDSDSLELIQEWKPAAAASAAIPVAAPAPAQAAAVPTVSAAPLPAAPAMTPPAAAAPAAIVVPTVSPAPAPTVAAAAPVLMAAPTAASAAPATPALAPPATAAPSAFAPGSNTGTSRMLGGTTGTSRALASGDASGLILEIQPYVKLRAGGRSRRYEILVRTPNRDASRDPAALDAHALQRLFSWLSTNRGAWNLEPTSFTLNLSITTLEDERFPQNVASALKSHGIAPDTIGFEIAEPLCTQRRAQVERFIALCDKVGCFVVIDDFSMDSSVLPLLRSKALRLVKIDPKLTSVALRDKLAQALVVATAQAVKVLGIHCSAKRVEGQQTLQWLTAIGCDFAQGPALSQVQPLDALAALQAAT
jgi:EAL domain-containing protein (putative c-di-GMP-specific phosphodiesterase class I)